jgi:exosortase
MFFSGSTKFSWLILLAAIWLPVVYLLGAQWSVFEEYNYGWAVPLLCLYLAGQEFPTRPRITAPAWRKMAVFLLVAAGLAYWMMRVLQEANPVWRLASYGLALSAMAMTLLAIYLTQGGNRAGHFIFPVAFFLVAVPWPTPVEDAVIQTLTRFNASLVVEVLNFAGVPALGHGNVIEISTGMVGIDEACSGIRSFQATLMIALFLGAFYRLAPGRRWWLLGAGPALALAFNFARTLVLVFVASREGLPAMEKWHDPTGVALLLGCFFCLWGVALWLKKSESREQKAESGKQISEAADNGQRTTDGGRRKAEVSGQKSVAGIPSSALRPLALAIWIVAWAVMVEVSTEVWFRSHEMRGGQTVSWTARWPVANPTFQTNRIPQNALRMLQCDENSAASWMGAEGELWQAFYLRWLPADSFYGRAKVALSKSHNPAICLTAAGMKMETQLAPVSLPVRPGFNLIFDRFVFADKGREVHVFFAQTEDMAGGGQASLRMTHLDRWRAALAGSRNYGQNNFEVALTGPATPDDALRLFSARLPELIKTEP